MKSPESRPLFVRRGTRILVLALIGLGLTACGSGGSGSAVEVEPGDFGARAEKPGGGSFFRAAHAGGGRRRLHLRGLRWGRLVDVHDLDPSTGEARPAPVFRDLVINQNIQTDGTDFRLEISPVTQAARLVVQRTDGAPDDGRGSFTDLVLRAERSRIW